MRQLIESLCSPECDGRRPGTPGGEAARRIVVEAFREAGLDPREQPVPGCGGANVLATIRGDSERYVLVGAHFDHLGSYGPPSVKKLEFNEPVYATAKGELVDPGTAHQVLRHLDGWGHGLHTGANLPAYPGTRGTTNSAWATYLVKGGGTLEVRIGCARTGFVTARIEV